MSDLGDKVIALAPCFTCGNGFDFNPETVPTIMIDPVTNKPPDANGLPDPEAVKRAKPEPICPACARKIRATRIANGLPTWRSIS